jgi:hypothetical protein
MTMPIVMNKKDNADAQIQDLYDQFHEAVAAWKAFVDKAGKAYNDAYNRQGLILRHIHDQLQADRDAEAKILTMALSLVTVGIAGGIAGSLAGKMAKGMEKEAAADFIKWAEGKAKDGAKAATAASVKYLHPEKLAPDPFDPAGDSPLSYFLEMSQRIDTRDYDVHHVTNMLSGLNLPLDMVRDFEQRVLDTPFVTEAPDPHAVDEDLLYRKASLGLWITWAYQRDEEYWAARSDDINQESMEFDPLRIELGGLGVPNDLITLKQTGKTKRSPYVSPYFYGKTGLNMKAFIDWATSVHAAVEMFKGMPKNQYTAMAEREMIDKSCAHFVGV